MSRRMHPLGARLVLLAASCLVCLAGAEALLRILTHFPIHPKDANRRPHWALGYVMSSNLHGIDEEGFRNPAGLEDVDLVAIGDSHTYGFNVVAGESWPAQLAQEGRISVYNYGMGGYGILQYRWLFPRALERHPTTIIVALYPANDLGDYCAFSELEHWRPELQQRGLATCTGPAWKEKPVRERAQAGVTRLWLSTATGSALEYLFWREIEMRRDPDAFVRVAYGSHETFLPKALLRRHDRYTDFRDPSIARAARATEVLLSEMIELARQAEVGLGVLFIPSKENVLLEGADPSDPFLEDLQRIVGQERGVTSRLKRYLGERDVATASAVECLRERIDVQLYPRDANLHPLREGYACYAEEARTLVVAAKAS